MKSEEVILNGKKIKIVTKIPEELKDDTILTEDLEKTLDLTTEINLEKTQEIKVKNDD